MRKQEIYLPAHELHKILGPQGSGKTKAGKRKKPNLRKLVSAKRQAQTAELYTEHKFTLIVVESRLEDDGQTPVQGKPRMFMVPMTGCYADVTGDKAGGALLQVARDNCPYPTKQTMEGYFRFHTPTLAVRLRTADDDAIFLEAGNTGMVTVSDEKQEAALRELGLTLSDDNAQHAEEYAKLELEGPLTPAERMLALPFVMSNDGTMEERVAKAAKVIGEKRMNTAENSVKPFPV